MEQLFEKLADIQEILEQILGITQNQMTILLDTQLVGDGLEIIEQMATYKETLTGEVVEAENAFQGLYQEYKETVQTVEDKRRLKRYVDDIMKLKERVIEIEQKNMMIMQDLLRRCSERVEIPKTAHEVTKLYSRMNKQ